MAILLDGGVGTALIARGLKETDVPERWLLDRLDEVVAVHRSHVRAGAEVVLTCTLNAHPPLLRPHGLHSFSGEIRRMAVHAARSAGAPRVYGVVGPLPPRMDPRQVEAFAEAAAADLAQAGADGLCLETITTLEEGVARVRGAALTGLPLVASMVPGTPAADDPMKACRELMGAGATLIGANCAPPAECMALLGSMAGLDPSARWAKPSAGTPRHPVSPQAWADGALRIARMGVGWIGGCCGVDAAMLAALKRGMGALMT
ncbi:MAG: homocysteine S-methyltransferase family protein [Deltaproteobacteria bacterium]|nr:homocysteine S-methyltransferase family protein [Deltaproteobacteria bacterium]